MQSAPKPNPRRAPVPACRFRPRLLFPPPYFISSHSPRARGRAARRIHRHNTGREAESRGDVTCLSLRGFAHRYLRGTCARRRIHGFWSTIFFLFPTRRRRRRRGRSGPNLRHGWMTGWWTRILKGTRGDGPWNALCVARWGEEYRQRNVIRSMLLQYYLSLTLYISKSRQVLQYETEELATLEWNRRVLFT